MEGASQLEGIKTKVRRWIKTKVHGVEAGHQRGAPGKIPLHQPRQQHVADGDAGACQRRADKKQRYGGEPAQSGAKGQKQDDAE